MRPILKWVYLLQGKIWSFKETCLRCLCMCVPSVRWPSRVTKKSTILYEFLLKKSDFLWVSTMKIIAVNCQDWPRRVTVLLISYKIVLLFLVTLDGHRTSDLVTQSITKCLDCLISIGGVESQHSALLWPTPYTPGQLCGIYWQACQLLVYWLNFGDYHDHHG